MLARTLLLLKMRSWIDEIQSLPRVVRGKAKRLTKTKDF